MNRSLILAVSSLLAMVILTVIESAALPDEVKVFVEPFVHHLQITAQGLIIGGFLLFVFGEMLSEHFGPIIREGFESIGKSVAGKMVGQGSIGEELARSLREFSTQLSPAINSLVQQGKIEEAVAQVNIIAADEKTKKEEEIAVLLHSEDPKDWQRVLEIADLYQLSSRYYLTVAYRFWTAKNVSRALEIAEEGLANEEQRASPDSLLLSKFHNSLAYYYADADRIDKCDIAKRYAEATHAARPNEPGPLDTLGYVLITFGTSPGDIRSGIDHCYNSWKRGTSTDVFTRHLDKAKKRLSKMESGG